MATAHLIHGYLGAGKTAFARRLEQDLRAIRFTHDEWMSRLYGVDPPGAMFPAYFDRVSRLIDSVWPRCLELGLDVVLDLNFWLREQRDRVRQEARALGAEVCLYRLVCPDEEAWDRIERRNAHLTSGLFIARETFEALKSRFEPLGDDEHRIEITTCYPASSRF